MMEEPTVLDYVISILDPRKPRIRFPSFEAGKGDIQAREQSLEPEPGEVDPEPGSGVVLRPGTQGGKPAFAESQAPGSVEKPGSHETQPFPWRMVFSVFAALLAQRLLEPVGRHPTAAILFYCVAGLLLVWSFWTREWTLEPIKELTAREAAGSIRSGYLLISLPLALACFLLFSGNRFSAFNLLIWAAALIYTFTGLWEKREENKSGLLERARRQITGQPLFTLRVGWIHLALLAVMGVSVYFRFSALEQVPGEMFSDHAEKLLDVSVVLDGETPIFFPRNTGREAIQMYLTAGVARLFQTGLSFMSLKIGTAIAGFLSLIFIFLFGKEVGNHKTGILAFFLAGIAYWPNLISRIGLRFPLYMLFAAPVLYYLFRGLRTGNRNYFILCGLALGLGLHGYSPMRVVPVLVLILIGIYLLHPQNRVNTRSTLFSLVSLGYVAFIIFLPLFRYMTEDPQMFLFRSLTRLGTVERAYPGPVALVFLENFWKASIMPFWDNGNIWVHSVPNRPALDIVTAAFYFCGVLLLLFRYARERKWQDLCLLLSVPLFMMPSILSLAFPDENPSLNRTSGAVLPVFVIAAIGAESFFSTLARSAASTWRKVPMVVLALVLLGWTTAQNYDLVFRQFNQQFRNSAWNTSEIGGVVRAFADSIGSGDSAYVVPFPHWVDTRLVGINAGFPGKDFALWPDDFNGTLINPRPKLFILKNGDRDNLTLLSELYPSGNFWTYRSAIKDKDFILFFVAPEKDKLAR